jgi:hypothetical protein
MAEIQTADGADGVKVLSPQDDPQAKSDAKDSDDSGDSRKVKPQTRRGGAVTSKTTSSDEPKRNAQGTVITQWDNDDNDPNKRASIAEDPTGESNQLAGH